MSTATLRRFALLVTAFTAVGCAAGPGGTSAGPRRDRNTITTDELKDTQASTLYDVVQRIHPEWLIPHTQGAVGGTATGSAITGGGSDSQIQVFMDTQHAGGLEVLKQFSPNQATQLKFYSSSEAQARFGNGNLNGVIQIVTTTKP